MKKKQINIIYYYIIIYSIFILTPLYLNKSIEKEEIKEKIDLMNRNNNLPKILNYEKTYKNDIKANPDKKGIDVDDDMPDEIKKLIEQIGDLSEEIDRINTEISKRKIYIIFFSVICAILFLFLVIYSSIKCFILCTKRYEPIYRISYVNSSQCLAVSMAEYEESKIDSKEPKSEDYDAPIHASVKSNKKKKYNTINPDKYKSTKEDKDLYKPYNSEDFQ